MAGADEGGIGGAIGQFFDFDVESSYLVGQSFGVFLDLGACFGAVEVVDGFGDDFIEWCVEYLACVDGVFGVLNGCGECLVGGVGCCPFGIEVGGEYVGVGGAVGSAKGGEACEHELEVGDVDCVSGF